MHLVSWHNQSIVLQRWLDDCENVGQGATNLITRYFTTHFAYKLRIKKLHSSRCRFTVASPTLGPVLAMPGIISMSFWHTHFAMSFIHHQLSWHRWLLIADRPGRTSRRLFGPCIYVPTNSLCSAIRMRAKKSPREPWKFQLSREVRTTQRTQWVFVEASL